ncbi:4-hydroxy-tetrahydrodipicolinate reductase, partial [Turicibacter sanguinis]|nr:4-hydroxy-tetrahydrodipicolinate reductase [Turicibacter sanguinis]
MKKIVVGGLNGKMGSFLVEALKNEEDLKLVAGVSEVEDLTGDIPVYSDPQKVINEIEFDVYVDFTVYE